MTSRWGNLLRQLLVLAVVVGAWQLYYMYGGGSPSLRKSPHEVWTSFQVLIDEGTLFNNLLATMKAVVIALVLAIVIGVTVGLLLALSPKTSNAVQPLLSGLNSMPRVALAPVFIVAFGITMQAKVALAFSIVVFIMILNAQAGVKSADPDVVRMATAMGASRRHRFFKILLPVAAPSIFAAIRLGLIYSLLGVVTSELIASQDGLGQLVAERSASFRMADVYAILIVLAVIASVLNSITGALERYFLRWQPTDN